MQLLIQHHSTLFGNLQLEQSARRLRSESLSNSTTQLTIPNYSSQPTSSSESPALPAISLTDFSTAEQSRTGELYFILLLKNSLLIISFYYFS